MRLNDGTIAQRLRSTISQTYGLFIGRYVQIVLNGLAVQPFQIPIGGSARLIPATMSIKRETSAYDSLRASLQGAQQGVAF